MTTVAVLGTGIMGAGMARSLARAGHDVTVWNRTLDKARPLAEAGARVAEDPTSAVAGADVVLTMLFDADAVERTMRQALPALADGAVWVQSSTVGLEAAIRLAGLAAEHGVDVLDAPVLGSRQAAEEGTVIVMAGGPSRLREVVTPVFDAIGSRTIWVGERPGDGHRLKLAANTWVLSVVGATAQAVGLTRDLGVDPQRFLDTIAGGGLDCPLAQLKGRAMIAGEFPPEFSLDGAAKDSGLITEAMREAGTDDHLMAALNDRFAAAAGDGHGAEDMAAVVLAVQGRRS